MSQFWIVAGHFKFMRKIRENDILYCILNGSIGFIDFEKVGFALKIKSLKIWRFGGGNFGI